METLPPEPWGSPGDGKTWSSTSQEVERTQPTHAVKAVVLSQVLKFQVGIKYLIETISTYNLWSLNAFPLCFPEARTNLIFSSFARKLSEDYNLPATNTINL